MPRVPSHGSWFSFARIGHTNSLKNEQKSQTNGCIELKLFNLSCSNDIEISIHNLNIFESFCIFLFYLLLSFSLLLNSDQMDRFAFRVRDNILPVKYMLSVFCEMYAWRACTVRSQEMKRTKRRKKRIMDSRGDAGQKITSQHLNLSCPNKFSTSILFVCVLLRATIVDRSIWSRQQQQQRNREKKIIILPIYNNHFELFRFLVSIAL